MYFIVPKNANTSVSNHYPGKLEYVMTFYVSVLIVIIISQGVFNEASYSTTKNLEKKTCSEVGQIGAGEWTSWSPWTDCTSTCGFGVRNRTRTCSKPSQGSRDCPLGEAIKTESCFMQKCPGQFSSRVSCLSSKTRIFRR